MSDDRQCAELTEAARALLDQGRLDEANALAQQALRDDDRSADAHSVMASIINARGDWLGSLGHLRRAHELMPDGPQVALNLALALLRLGNYREGLPLYEDRIAKPTWSGFATLASRVAAKDALLRGGDPVAGRRILVLAEQGLGDGIMFARYIPMLAARGARIALACNPILRAFFARIDGIETLLSPPPDQPFAQINLAAFPFDAWVPLLSLAHWFGTDADSVPADIPYWQPGKEEIALWQQTLRSMGRPGVPKVGLVFEANRIGGSFGAKSMAVSDLMPLLAVGAVDFVNLQHGSAGRALAAAAPGMLDPVPDELPLDAYGAVILATDLVITVDTMAAHCAGALGHASWVAVPHSPYWVWGLGGATTPWYPAVRIFRQETQGDWSGVIASFAAQLNAGQFASGGGKDAHDIRPRNNRRGNE